MNEVKIYNSEEFGNIRTVTIDNEPWFVGRSQLVLSVRLLNIWG